MIYEQLFLCALFLTLLAEMPVVYIFSRYLYKIDDNTSIIFAGVITSALTLPYFWFILPTFIPDRMTYIIVGESAIVLIEAYIYFYILKLEFSKALIMSLAANVASILFGLFML